MNQYYGHTEVKADDFFTLVSYGLGERNGRLFYAAFTVKPGMSNEEIDRVAREKVMDIKPKGIVDIG